MNKKEIAKKKVEDRKLIQAYQKVAPWVQLRDAAFQARFSSELVYDRLEGDSDQISVYALLSMLENASAAVNSSFIMKGQIERLLLERARESK